MKTASARLIIDRNGSDVPVNGITPAEAQLLVYKHMGFCGKMPITALKEDSKPVERTDNQEFVRLKNKYGKTIVEELFGKVNPRFPADFKAALLTSAPESDEPETKESTEFGGKTPAAK